MIGSLPLRPSIRRIYCPPGGGRLVVCFLLCVIKHLHATVGPTRRTVGCPAGIDIVTGIIEIMGRIPVSFSAKCLAREIRRPPRFVDRERAPQNLLGTGAFLFDNLADCFGCWNILVGAVRSLPQPGRTVLRQGGIDQSVIAIMVHRPIRDAHGALVDVRQTQRDFGLALCFRQRRQ